MNYPKVYLFRKIDDKYDLYFGEFSTLEGLNLLDKNLKIKFKEFGATNYKKYGYATENDIPKLETTGEFIQFIESEDFIDIIHCEIEIDGIRKLSTHDDAECSFVVEKQEIAFNLIIKSSPPFYQNKILSELINNQNKYIKIDPKGNIERFFTFEDYIKNCL